MPLEYILSKTLMDKQYGLIFDVDGVIADTEAVNAGASIKMFERLFGLKGVKRDDFQAGLGRGAAAYVRAAADIHGLTMTETDIEKATAERQRIFLEILKQKPLPAFPGVLRLIDEALADPIVKVAIATSSTKAKSSTVLESAQIPLDKMEYINGDDVKNKKPDPEIFLTAAGRIDTPPERCAVIEDAPDGVRAARFAGTKCLAVTNSAPAEKLKEADLVVSSLSETDIDGIKTLIDS